MASHNKLNETTWIDIRTKFEIGIPTKVIAREYSISPGTIRHRVKNERWTRILQEKMAKFSEVIKMINETNAGLIMEQVQGLAEVVTSSRMPVVMEKLQEQVNLIGDVRQFITKAAALNVKYLNELDNSDLSVKDRISGLSVLKATVKDLADIKTMPELPLDHTDAEESPENQPLQITYVKKIKDDSTDDRGVSK